MSGNRSKSTFFEGGWVTLRADFRGKGASPTNDYCRFVWYQNIRSALLSFDGRTDRQTDRQNCDSNTVRCITCSRTVKTKNSLFEPPFGHLGDEDEFSTNSIYGSLESPWSTLYSS